MNINPAMNFEKHSTNMSAEEFQEKLCAWLQKKGLLCELRNYFRTNMVAVLSNTSLVSTNDIKHLTPKAHAVNLLISEFLALAEYHYSLCVFCTEASLINVFPDFTKEKVHVQRDKFSRREVFGILETLGILEESEHGNRIYSTYCNSNADSLLTCILNAYSSTPSIDERVDVCDDCDDNYAFAFKNISKLLMKSTLPYDYQVQIKYYIKYIYDKQDEKSLLAQKNIREKYKNELSKYKQKIKALQNSFNVEKVRLQKELVEMKLNLKQHTVSSTRQEIVEKTENEKVVEQPSRRADRKQENQDVENVDLKRLIRQLQTENTNLRSEHFTSLKRIQDVGNKAEMLLHELKTKNRQDKSTETSREYFNSRSTADINTSRQMLNLDSILQEARDKLKELEIESSYLEKSVKYYKGGGSGSNT